MTQKQDHPAIVTLDIAASADAVWSALTKPKIISQYLHGSTVVTDWQVGGPITWEGTWNGKPYQDKGIVLAYKPGKLLKTTHWSPMSGTKDSPENYHVVTYELTPQGNHTTLTLTQTNNASRQAAETMAKTGWLPILQALKSLVEKSAHA